MTPSRLLPLVLLLCLAGCWEVTDSYPPERTGPRLVVIVYESAEQAAPLHTHTARLSLESQGHQVRVIDDDVSTGEGQVPAEVAGSIAKAREVGLPALVVSVGDEIILAVPLPDTAEQIVTQATQ